VGGGREDHEFQANLDYIVRPCFNKTNETKDIITERGLFGRRKRLGHERVMGVSVVKVHYVHV
jgi:hypothetical protein